MQPLAGLLVVDLTRHLPGPFASRELLRLGARVVRLESPDGDPLRDDRAAVGRRAQRRQGVGRLRSQGRARARAARSARARTSCSRASGRASPPASASARTTCPTGAVYCSITGFGVGRAARAARRPRPQLPRLGRRARGHGARRCRRCRSPTSRAGALAAVTRDPRRAARARAHGPRSAARRLDDARLAPSRRAPLGGDPIPKLLTGGARVLPHLRDRRRPLADGRRARAEVLRGGSASCSASRTSRSGSSRTTSSRSRASSPRAIAARPLAEWLELFDGEDVCGRPGRDARGGRGASSRAAPSNRALLRRSASTPTPGAPSCLRETERRGQLAQVGQPESASGNRPSRSSRNARIPSARAPSTSSSGVSPTIAVSGAATSSCSSTARKIDSCGFTLPCARDESDASTSSAWCATNASRSRAVFETSPSLSPRARSVVERRQHVVVEVEVVRVLPGARHLDGALVRALGVAAHAADDPLGEQHPHLFVVLELRMQLERVEARRGAPRRSATRRARARSARRVACSPRARGRGRASRA